MAVRPADVKDGSMVSWCHGRCGGMHMHTDGGDGGGGRRSGWGPGASAAVVTGTTAMVATTARRRRRRRGTRRSALWHALRESDSRRRPSRLAARPLCRHSARETPCHRGRRTGEPIPRRRLRRERGEPLRHCRRACGFMSMRSPISTRRRGPKGVVGGPTRVGGEERLTGPGPLVIVV